MSEIVKEVRDHIGHQWSDHTFVQSEKVRDIMRRAADRIEFLEGLFDFNEPDTVVHVGPNDGVTKDALVVLRTYYDGRTAERIMLHRALIPFAGAMETSEAEKSVPNDSPVTITCQLGDVRRARAALHPSR